MKNNTIQMKNYTIKMEMKIVQHILKLYSTILGFFPIQMTLTLTHEIFLYITNKKKKQPNFAIFDMTSIIIVSRCNIIQLKTIGILIGIYMFTR